MAVTCPIHFDVLTDEEFRTADYQVMKHVFASHNELGRRCDEQIYQADIAERLEVAGFGPVRTEVPVVVSWREFRKTYFLDLVLGNALLYELKTVASIVGEHKTHAHTQDLDNTESHLARFLKHTTLRAMQWVNFNHAQISIVTLVSRCSGL